MDTPGHYTSKPLTSQHLHSSSFDKLDKSHFITSYIHAQSVHAGDYAVEGRTLSSSWVWQTPDNESPNPPPEQSHGFETPVLKPRVSNPPKSLAVETIAPVSEQREFELTRQLPERPTTKAAPWHPHKKASKTRQSAQHTTESAGKTTSKRPSGKHTAHMPDVNPDGEQVARLAARRDRKRAKRAIVNPVVPENDCNDEHPTSEGKKKKRKQEKKPKIPAAFALMHGFSAANIGKNRLTLTTPGVFNKGKASAKTRVVDIKTKKDGHFSEYVFLNSAKAQPPKRKRQSTSSSSSESGPEYLSAASIVDTNRTSPKNQNLAKTVEVRTKADSLAVPQQGKTTVESEVWDIELENSSPVSESISKVVKGGTVVMNTSGIQWCASDSVVAGNVGMSGGVVGEDREQTGIFPKTCSARGGVDIHSSPSLGPSQSASQSGRRGHLGSNIPVVTGFSRYFPQLTVEPVGHLAPKHSNPMSTLEDSTSAVYTTQRHFNTLNSPPDRLELISAKPSSICGTSEHYAETPLVPPPVNHFYNLADRLDIASSPNSLERAVEEYEAENHIFRAFLNKEELDPRNSYEPTFYGTCHNDILELDQGKCKGWCPGYQEPSEYYSSDTFPNHSDNLDWPDVRVAAYPYMDMVQDGDPLYRTVDGDATAWDLSVPPATQDYGEFECLCEDEFMASGESQVEDGQRYEPYNDVRSDGFCPKDLAIQSETRPGTELSLSTRRSDNASGAAGSLLQQFSQGRAILGLSGHHDARYPTLSKFDTVLRAETDVATSLKGHWLPQKL